MGLKVSRANGLLHEQEAARLLGGERVPLSGAAGGNFGGDLLLTERLTRRVRGAGHWLRVGLPLAGRRRRADRARRSAAVAGRAPGRPARDSDRQDQGKGTEVMIDAVP